VKVLNKVKFTIYKISDFVEADGTNSLKCVTEITTKRFSQKKQKYYTQKEVYFNTFLRGNQEQFDKLKERMIEQSTKVSENKSKPFEERKRMSKRPYVTIFAYGFELYNYYFAAKKSSVCSVYIDEWDFARRQMKKHKQSIYSQEEVDEIIAKEKKKYEIKLQKELEKQENELANLNSRRIIF
jgi:hypothetical protein